MLAGKAARNWVIGCIAAAQRGRSPIHTPLGSQLTLAAAVRITTRRRVKTPSSRLQPISRIGTPARMKAAAFQPAKMLATPRTTYQIQSAQVLDQALVTAG